jgi:ribosomal protein S18 acetylase RimI-like enzyme
MADIRPASTDELPVVATCLRRMLEDMAAAGGDALSADPAGWSDLEARLRAKADDPDRLWLLAREADVVVGLAGVEVHVTPLFHGGARRLHVSAVWVAPAQRRQGLARRLLDDAFAWGRGRGCAEVDLNVLVSNPARALYERLGFVARRVEMRRAL